MTPLPAMREATRWGSLCWGGEVLNHLDALVLLCSASKTHSSGGFKCRKTR